MIRGSLGVRTSSGSSAAAAYELIAPTIKSCLVREMQISLAAATASIYGLGRPAAIGITPTTPVTLLNDRNGDPYENLSKTAVAWGTGPTVPAAFIRRVGFPAVIGSVISWVFENGLLIPAGGSLILWNLAANGVIDVSVVVDE